MKQQVDETASLQDSSLTKKKNDEITVRWLSVDGHSVDSHYVVCHLGRVLLRKLLRSRVVYVALL